jgi:hypothetical protein
MPEVEGFVDGGIEGNNAGWVSIVVFVKEQQLNRGGMLGKQGKVDAMLIWDGAQWMRAAFFEARVRNAHRSSHSYHGTWMYRASWWRRRIRYD